MKKKTLILVSVFILSLYANKEIKASTTQNETQYTKAMDALKAGNNFMAGEMFEKIEDIQPFTEDATNGLIMASYSYYKAGQHDDSNRVIDYFIQSNPTNKNLPYMLYLRSLNYYDRISSVARGRDVIESANFSFRDLIYKYPNTEYAKDAQSKLERIETFLSGNEMDIANYYFKRKNYIGATNHYIKVLKDYPKSDFVPEALYRLVEINSLLNLNFEAKKYNEILTTNFKDTTWSENSTKIIEKNEEKNEEKAKN